MKYIKQLDTVRAVAVILVVISHWLPGKSILNALPNGEIGVNTFFVLSGFLITKILFDNREKSGEQRISKTIALKNFYVRRALRIFPIYYLSVFLLLAFWKFTGTNLKSSIYLLTYTQNFYFFKLQDWEGIISPLWSLAVEEQFYLIWPWFILFLNKKFFPHLIIAFILVGIVSQSTMGGIPMSYILTFTCFDAFGLGALLAWLITYKPQYLNIFFSWLTVLALISFIFFIIGLIQDDWIYIPLRTIISITALWIIAYIIRNQNGRLRFKFILNNSFLIFIGKISYGIYIYHSFIPKKLNIKIINIYLNPLLPDMLYKKYWSKLFLVENIILLIGISWLSYVIIEKPFLKLKAYFNYKNRNSLQVT